MTDDVAWDTCPGCGQRHGQPESARFDEEGDPVASGPYHPHCVPTPEQFLAGPGSQVFMYRRDEPGPLSHD